MRAVSITLNRLSDSLNRVALVGAALAVAVMLAAAGWQVIARYLLNQPPIWTEELARFSMVWGGLLGASCAFRLRRDPTLFPEALKATGARGLVFTVLRSFGVLCFILPILWFSLLGSGADPARGYLARLAGRQTETMDLPMVVFGVAIPLAFALILLHVLADIASALDNTRNDE
ncbi:putative TRAP transporter DctQ component (plasmid) [Octadecabacter arcticus 238]|jgi:TRAP-type C4-dicarboxylate transport system permease small subunit|uniref:TRAP transporter small permease protein n=1 Tax=Octadecabacter arcticus 238 TaxID=391616 RepID=M9RYM1_9RHOB|nr:TRAP transporter small permease subunit [Octadecabacter arcticus]AGI74935.1 putative TRAP transporter DctQ component [Octadecabacter arcticus 238]